MFSKKNNNIFKCNMLKLQGIKLQFSIQFVLKYQHSIFSLLYISPLQSHVQSTPYLEHLSFVSSWILHIAEWVLSRLSAEFLPLNPRKLTVPETSLFIYLGQELFRVLKRNNWIVLSCLASPKAMDLPLDFILQLLGLYIPLVKS